MADNPITRKEKYLAKLTGSYTGNIPDPITRVEKYLYDLCQKGISGLTPEEIENAVNKYLKENPVQPGATTEQAQQIEQNKTDIALLKKETGSLKEEIVDINDAIIVKKNETFSGKDIDWINGFYDEDGTITPHTLYKHTRVFKVEPETKVTYAYLRSPANYSPYIACFKNGVYIKKSSLLGDVDANFKSGEFTIPQDIDGISFASYDAPNDERLSISGIFLYYKPDVNAEKIENIENNIQHMESDIAGNYNQIYNVKKYTITDGIGIKGNYYDKNGKLQPADNLSTTGIFPIPYGIKSITYTAFRNVDIPTILFLSADMKVAGMVIATTAPTYGDTMYSGIAEIPSNAVYMEFSVLNTNNDSSVTVMYSNIESNQKRIELLEKDPLYGKKITCTGNSITAATHSVPGHGYVEQIADAHGMTVDNHAIWGAIIPQGHPRANDDVTDIGCIHDTLDDMDADADIVIMSGSINDCEYYADTNFLGEITGDFSTELDLTTFYGALEDMCKKALQKWAGKPIIYVIEHRMTLDNTTYGQYYLKLHEAIVKVMNKWGISIADLFNDCPSLNCNEGYKTKYTIGDGTHPNYEGYERFYVPRVYAEIKKMLGI
jgi:lysophospholipase L1-like esterase